MKTAFQWQVADVKNYFLRKGYSGIDTMLAFLEKNKADYPLWVASDAYTVTLKFFINSSTAFSEEYNINNSRRTFLALQSVMKKIEAFEIEPTLTSDLFDLVKAEILASTVSTDNAALLKYIRVFRQRADGLQLCFRR